MSRSKSFLWLLLIGVAFVVALISYGEWSGPAQNEDAAVIPAAPKAKPAVFSPVEESSDSKDDFLRDLIAKLQQWKGTSDPQLLGELESQMEALLTDANAADIFRALPLDLRGTPFARKVLDRWSKSDPAAAVDWLAKSPPVSHEEVQIAVHNWADHDFNGLQQYLANLPNGEWKQRVLVTAADSALAVNRPEDAIAWLIQLAPGNIQPDTMDAAAKMWAAQDFNAAVNWVNAQQNSQWKDRLLADITAGLAQNDPVAAISFARSYLQTDDSMDTAIQGIVSTWAAKDPAAAANWVALLPQSDSRTHALNMLITTWWNNDPSADVQWISTSLTGQERDQAFTQLTEQSTQGDYATAANLVMQISPGQVQNDLGSGIVGRWATDDFNAASTWVNNLPSGAFKQLAQAQLTKAGNGPSHEP